MLSFFLRLGENRIQQLNKQEKFDEEISKMHCYETIRDLFLFERAVQVSMARKMYENSNPLDIYNATKANMDWVDSHQMELDKILSNSNKSIACYNLSTYLKKVKKIKIDS